ncbi:hypothetical protein GW17_00036625, partial [Ensete ventricosum]
MWTKSRSFRTRTWKEKNAKETTPSIPTLALLAPGGRAGLRATLLWLLMFPRATLFLACSPVAAANLAAFSIAAGLFAEADAAAEDLDPPSGDHRASRSGGSAPPRAIDAEAPAVTIRTSSGTHPFDPLLPITRQVDRSGNGNAGGVEVFSKSNPGEHEQRITAGLGVQQRASYGGGA